MAQKHNYEYIKKTIESNGYILITDEYINNLQKLKMICPEGHECELSFGKFISGRRCQICSKKNKNDSLKLPFKEIEKNFNKEGYELISREYIKANQKLQYKCPNGHIHEMSYNSFQQGHRCPTCQKSIKYEYDFIKEYFEQHGFRLLSDSYEKAHGKLLCECKNGHKHFTTWVNFRKRPICLECEGKIVNAKIIKEKVEKEGYFLKTDNYINNRQKLEFKCPKNHTFFMSWHDFNGGCRCPHCKVSKGEDEIRRILNFWNIEFVSQKRFENCRDSLELPFDFYIPSLNACIEYDGEQHYKPIEVFGGEIGYAKTKRHDEIKTHFCKDNNINLIRIPYWEFNNIENILKQNLNI